MSHLFEYTGNPFVDAGISALVRWCGKKKPQELTAADVKKAVPEIADVFSTNEWSKNAYSIFPNGIFTNSSIKKSKKREVWLELISGFVKDFKELGKSGSCIACGRRDALKKIKGEKRGFFKSEVPLTGSGKLLNYYSFGQLGADYCSVCAMAIQFSPLVYFRSGGKMILVHSSSQEAMRSWAKDPIKDVFKQKNLNDYSGCYTKNFTNPQNALFHIAKTLIQDKEDWKNEPVAIRIYHFTNYNQGPELNYYDLPARVFHFLNEVHHSEESKDWNNIVRKEYFIRKSKNKEDSTTDTIPEEEYQNNNNAIYDGLLHNKWIIKYFYNFSKRKTYAKWALVQLYLKEVRQMDKQRIETLKRVADEIAEFIKNKDNLSRLEKLESSERYNEFCNQLRFIVKERIQQQADKPLFSLDEYVEDLFPDGAMSWKETQDIILFRIYEVLHEWIIIKTKEKSIQSPEQETSDK